MPLLAAVTVVLFAGGVVLIVAGWRGTPERGRRRASVEWDAILLRRIGLSVGIGLLILVLTRWYGFALAVGAVLFALTGLYADRSRRALQRDRLRAVVLWLEMLRDSMSAGAGIVRAIQMTSSRVPSVIASDVGLLSARLDSVHVDDALNEFGAGLDVPAVDTAIAALVISVRTHGASLSGLLRGVINSTRQQLGQQERIEAMRTRFTTASTLMVAVTSLTSIIIIGGSAEFRSSYDSAVGQFVIAIVGALFVVAVGVLRRMAAPTKRPRLLGRHAW